MERYGSLRDVRYLNGNLTQKQMAERLGISVGAYNLIEKGQRYGSTRTWRKIQQVFDLTDAEVWRLQKQKQD